MIKKIGIVLGCVVGVIIVLFTIAFIILNPVINVEKEISKIDLNSIDATSFKELTLIKQDYNKLSEFQKKCIENYDILVQAQSKYQSAKDTLTRSIKAWANVDYLPMADSIKINSQKIVNRDDGYYYLVSLTNTDKKAKIDFKLGITTYNETWTISNSEYSEKVDFTSGQTRTFEFRINPEKIDAVKIAYYKELLNNEDVMFDFGEQEILQINKYVE